MEIFLIMQVTKPVSRQWNTILHLVLSSLGFVKHFIYHALYMLQGKSIKEIIIVGCSTDEFLCAYSSTHLFQDFLDGLNKYLPVTYK